MNEIRLQDKQQEIWKKSFYAWKQPCYLLSLGSYLHVGMGIIAEKLNLDNLSMKLLSLFQLVHKLLLQGSVVK